MAEREGFEPSVEFPLHTLSRRAPSATRTPLHVSCAWEHPPAARRRQILATFFQRSIVLSGPEIREEVLQDLTAIRLENAAANLQPMIESPISDQISEGSTESRLRIAGSVDQPIDSTVDQGACTHRARLQSHEHCTTGQPPSFNDRGRSSDREHLGMRQRITVDFTAIEAACHECPLADDHGPYRYFTEIRRPSRLAERLLHPTLIIIHGSPLARRDRASAILAEGAHFTNFLPRTYHGKP